MSWVTRKISELGDVVTGKTPSTTISEYFDGEYPFVTPSDIDYGHYYVRTTETKVTELARQKHKNQFVPKDAVLFTCIGNTMGKCAIASQDSLSNQQINAVIANDENDAKFIYYLLHHNRNLVRGIGMGGGAATPIINKSTFSNISLSVPSTKTMQRNIAEILEKYDDLIENNKRRISLLEESARQLYKEWFVRFRFPGHEHTKIVDGVPDGWVSGILSDFYKTSSGGTPSRKVQEYYTGNINWVKTQELVNSFIFETSEKITDDAIKKSSAKIFPENTVLVAMYGATIGQLGILAKESTTNQACCAVIPNSELSHFIHAYLFLDDNKSGLVSRAKGAAQNNISQDIVKNFEMVMPKRILMEQFIDSVSPIFSQLRVLTLEISKLNSARNILLPKLMNGELAV